MEDCVTDSTIQWRIRILFFYGISIFIIYLHVLSMAYLHPAVKTNLRHDHETVRGGFLNLSFSSVGWCLSSSASLHSQSSLLPARRVNPSIPNVLYSTQRSGCNIYNNIFYDFNLQNYDKKLFEHNFILFIKHFIWASNIKQTNFHKVPCYQNILIWHFY